MDGILTDGTMFYLEGTGWVRTFSVLDGQGLALLKKVGIEVGIITAANENISITQRFKILGIQYLDIGSKDKLKTLEAWKSELNLSWEQISYMGDDVPDFQCMKSAGFSTTVLSAIEPIKNMAHFIFNSKAGNGAVREFCDLLLLSQGKHPLQEFYQ